MTGPMLHVLDPQHWSPPRARVSLAFFVLHGRIYKHQALRRVIYVCSFANSLGYLNRSTATLAKGALEKPPQHVSVTQLCPGRQFVDAVDQVRPIVDVTNGAGQRVLTATRLKSQNVPRKWSAIHVYIRLAQTGAPHFGGNGQHLLYTVLRPKESQMMVYLVVMTAAKVCSI